MFAPLVAKTPSKAARTPAGETARQRPAPTIDLGKPTTSVTPRGVAWNIGNIPVTPPDKPGLPDATASRGLQPRPGSLQRKLAVGRDDDPLEHEADRVAEQVMRMPDSPATTTSAPTLRAKSTDGSGTAASFAPGSVNDVLGTPGRPLDPVTRALLEPRFGYDFSRVRIHEDAHAAQSAREVQARAYTVGPHVVFGAGEYAPTTWQGRQLLAHELAHVVQQGSAGVLPQTATSRVGPHDVATETLPQAGPVLLQRKKLPAGDELPDDLDVTWDGDGFSLSFDRVQTDATDYLKVFVTYKGGFKFDGPFVHGNTAELRIDIAPQPLKVQLTESDAGVRLDLYGDGTQKVQIVDHYTSQAGKGRNHDLQLRQLGQYRDGVSTWVLDPSAKAQPKPDPGSELPPDVPGEVPSGTMEHGPGGVPLITLRIDGDGDQYKELLLGLRPIENWSDPFWQDIPKRLQVTVKQISSGKTQAATFNLPKPALRGSLFPIVRQVTDGKLPTVIDLETPSNSALLEVQPPKASGADITYELTAGGESHTVKFQPEKAGLHQVASADPPKVVAGISSVDVTLGAYGDRFRLTLQPQPDNKATFGLSVLYGGEPDRGMGTTLQLTGPPRLSVLRQGGVSLEFDLDGDGKTDLEVFDRLDSPKDANAESNPEKDRNHHIRLVGPVVARGETVFETSVQNGIPIGAWANPNATDMEAASNAKAVSSLPRQTATFAGDLDRIETNLQKLRSDAVAASLISQATYDAWLALSKAMIQLRAELSIKVSAATQSTAASAAAAFYKVLAQEVSAANRVQPHQAGITTTNEYTGMRETSLAGMGTQVAGAGPELEAKIRAGNWAEATTGYNRLVSGLDRWIADRLKANPDRPAEARTAQYLGAAKTALGTIESKNPTRIQAVFHPEQQFIDTGRIAEVPLSLYFWREGDTWHLADLTNPLNTFEDTFAAAATDTAPPPGLFQKLDARIHFPKGTIHYQIPGGEGGSFHTTAATNWTDYLSYIGLGAAVVGLTLATLGTGTVAVAGAWILAASGVISAAATTAEMIEKWRHGNLDATTAVLDLAQIVASLSGAAALSSARIVTMAGGAIKAGVPWAGNWARLAVMADRVFVPMVGTKIAADVVTGAALTDVTAKQLDAVENGSGTRDAKDRAKLLLLSQAVLSGGMLALSIKGDLGSIKPGRKLILYYPPEENGVIKPPVALVGDVVTPTSLKFSQADIKPQTGEGMPVEDLTNAMKTGGWKGNPLEVVELPDGSKVSIDNRRLVAAQNAGLQEVPIAVHDAADLLPADQRERFKLVKNAIRRLDTGELVPGGNKGAVVYPKGSLPTTYEEAVLFRTANQGNLGGDKGKFPLMGSFDQPAIRVPKPAAPKPGTAKPGDIE